MYNEKIESLINFALADGELTEKEKQILFKKAKEEGIDLDEFEMVLDARLHEKKQNMRAPEVSTPVSAAPKSDKLGDIKKCPACGSIVQSYTAVCADCGYSFTNVSAASSVTKLYEQLQKIEAEERNRPTQSGWMEKLQGSSRASDMQMEERIKKRKAGVVSAFPIPNTKEDIIEFLSMAVPEAGKKPNFLTRLTAAGELYKAWHSKAEQVIMKARFGLKDDKTLLDEINYYAKQLDIK